MTCDVHGAAAWHPHYGCLTCRAERNERERQARIAERLPRALELTRDAIASLRREAEAVPAPGPQPKSGEWVADPLPDFRPSAPLGSRWAEYLEAREPRGVWSGTCTVHGHVQSGSRDLCTQCEAARSEWEQAARDFRRAARIIRALEREAEIVERAAVRLADDGYSDLRVAREYVLAEIEGGAHEE